MPRTSLIMFTSFLTSMEATDTQVVSFLGDMINVDADILKRLSEQGKIYYNCLT